MLGRIYPCLVAVGVLVRGAVARGDRPDLEVGEGAADLDVEGVSELRRGVAEVLLHPLALRVADLPDPAVLEHRKRRQEHQQDAGQERQTRGAGEPHSAECSTDENSVRY